MSATGFLTRKQHWRKQSRTIKRNDHDILYNEVCRTPLQHQIMKTSHHLTRVIDAITQGIGSNGGEIRFRSSSDPSVSDLRGSSYMKRLWATSEDLVNHEEKAHTIAVDERKVSFHTVVRVILIPSRAEYDSADLTVSLWWDDFDYATFKACAFKELRALMASRGLTDTSEAVKILYQSGYDDINAKIFPQVSTKPVPQSVAEIQEPCRNRLATLRRASA